MGPEIAAAGAVLWRPGTSAGETGGDTVEIAVVHRPRYDDWSLPKGKLERGETSRVAAAREVAEETGFGMALGRHLGRVRYPVTRPEPATKVVEFYAARARAGEFEPNDEVDELRWVPPESAADLLSYQHDGRIVASFTASPADLTTLLLVRHAKAGSRSDWHDEDDLRPLSENGRRQVPPINTLASLYVADRVHSAPLVRCVNTVRQVADRLGVEVVAEPLLSEAGYEGSEEKAAERLLTIAAAGGTPVVCSQGGVIPDLVSRVAGAAGFPLERVTSKKASVWALFFAGDDAPCLVGADYIPRP
ncbi:MAG TPA: NUDIX hydrolase [Actinophytocola sp.]|nr:NUDIX hydrolase [Actinophytocola sp.]